MPSVTGILTLTADSAALITPPSGAFIRVWNLSIMAKAADITVTVKTGSTTKFTVLCPATGVGGVSEVGAKEPLFEGAADEVLKLNLSGAAASGVAYNIWYSFV